ncbi:hypothetical protein Golax_000021, partial [Gossypium laxum]|nr:hypothetical protein [Gossypium laxum]
MRMSNGDPLGWSLMRFCTDVGTSLGPSTWDWGAIRYAPLLVLRQYRSRQFIPVTQGLAQCEF